MPAGVHNARIGVEVRAVMRAYIEAYVRKYGTGTTVREIADAMGLSVSNTFHHIKKLREEGYLAERITASRTVMPCWAVDVVIWAGELRQRDGMV